MPLDSNGTTVTFGGSSIGELQSVNVTKNGNPIDLTSLSSLQHEFLNGIQSVQVDITVFGTSEPPSLGGTGTLSVSWNDGGSDSIPNALVTSVSSSGSVDTGISSSVTLQPEKQ